MRRFRLLALLLLAGAMPAAAQMPISDLGRSGGGDWSAMQRWLRGGDERRRRESRAALSQRDVELGGQIDQLDRRIRRMRANGEITRAEARRMRRETARIGFSYYRYASDGLSDSEAGELQGRILAAASLAQPTRVPGRRSR